MRNTSSRILKASDVKVEGKFTLEVVQVESDASKKTSTALVEPQVRIVKSESEFSVVEITCSCGEKINLRCDYASVKAPAAPPQNGKPKAPNQVK
ncbi:MAG: hypothetical protein ACYS17_02100 [Planctomycetota bacterium]|jgi:hypothetical protein